MIIKSEKIILHKKLIRDGIWAIIEEIQDENLLFLTISDINIVSE
jgi:hypothetical protein